MRKNHKFVEYYNNINYIVLECHKKLYSEDICLYCNLMINKDMEKLFDPYSEKNDIKNIHNIINKNYPCITEEEFIIKKLLE